MMKALQRAAAAAVIALIVQGCSSNMQWSKPGADAPMVARDQDECRAVALGANRPAAPASSPDARSDGMRTGAMSQTAGSNERFVAEHEEIRRCMLRRGYQLRPTS